MEIIISAISDNTDGGIEFVQTQMRDYGIDVEEFVKRKLLNIYKIADFSKDLKGFEHSLEMLNIMLSALAPLRFVSRFSNRDRRRRTR